MRRVPGQTLIELLVALAVITTGLFAASMIIFSNARLSNQDAEEIVVVNLLREGIEEAKALRDANWLAGDPFDTGFVGGTNDYSATPQWDGGAATPGISFDFTANAMTDAATRVRQSTAATTPGFFTQTDPSATLTPWRRLLVFHPICSTAGGLTYANDGQTCGSDPKIGMRVEVQVEWTRQGQTIHRVMYEDLFDWR